MTAIIYRFYGPAEDIILADGSVDKNNHSYQCLFCEKNNILKNCGKPMKLSASETSNLIKHLNIYVK